MQHVSGTIKLPEINEGLESARVNVRVRDTRRMDTAAAILGEQTIESITQDQILKGSLPFDVIIETPSDDASISVWVHLDLDRDGQISIDDYVSMADVAVVLESDAPPLQVSVSLVQ